jgi:hypothetical protein
MSFMKGRGFGNEGSLRLRSATGERKTENGVRWLSGVEARETGDRYEIFKE